MADETRQLAKFAADLTYDQIPGRVRSLATDLLVDQVGVEIGCSDLPWAKQVWSTYRKAGGTPEATVVRYGDRLPILPAVFINSTFGHSFEYDDANPVIRGHPGAELIPALMAVSERDHVSGRDFLTALIAAYEVRGRIGWAVSPEMSKRGGPQASTTCGPFGAAAGVAKLLQLGTEGIRNALGIAGGFSGGLMQYDHGGGSVKRVYTAIAASGGLQSAHLAQAGITGPEGILEGVRGLLRIYLSEYRPERLVAEFGTMWTLESIYFKPYCCVGTVHPAIDGLRRIVTANALKAVDIEAVEVSYPSGIHDHVGVATPHDLLGMQFSTAYALAIAVLRGRNTPREYTMATLSDPEVREFAGRVQVLEEAGLDKLTEGRFAARIKVRTRSGQVFEHLMADAKGAADALLSSDEIDNKFRAQVTDLLGTQRCENLLKTLRDVASLEDIAQLPPMFVAEAERAPQPMIGS